MYMLEHTKRFKLIIKTSALGTWKTNEQNKLSRNKWKEVIVIRQINEI